MSTISFSKNRSSMYLSCRLGKEVQLVSGGERKVRSSASGVCKFDHFRYGSRLTWLPVPEVLASCFTLLHLKLFTSVYSGISLIYKTCTTSSNNQMHAFEFSPSHATVCDCYICQKAGRWVARTYTTVGLNSRRHPLTQQIAITSSVKSLP